MPLLKKSGEDSKRALTPIDQWGALNQVLKHQKVSNLILSGLSLLLGVGLVALAFQDPVVVLDKRDSREFALGKRRPVEVGKPEIVEVIQRFIKRRYQWEVLDELIIVKNLTPFVTEGLQKKTKATLKNLRVQGFQGKNVQQDISRVRVTVSKKGVSASFDKIIRIEGIPVLSPTNISLSVVKGPSTEWNPAGVYVQSVLEKGGAR